MKDNERERRRRFSDFMNKKYTEFWLARGRQTTQADFNQALGDIGEQNLSYYLHIPESKRLPNSDILLQLARNELIGSEIYDVLSEKREYDNGDPRHRFILTVFNEANEEGKKELIHLVEEHNRRKRNKVPQRE